MASDDGIALADYLGELRGGGTAVGSGSFTLDPKRALEKLENFQFLHPAIFLLPLLSALTPLQARRCFVSVSAREIVLEYECPPLSREQIETLFAYAFQGREAGLRHLALGLLGAQRLPGARVRLESGNTGAAVGKSGLKVLAHSQPCPGIRVTIQQRSLRSLVGMQAPLPALELSQVSSRVGYCGAEIRWNNERLPRSPAVTAPWVAHYQSDDPAFRLESDLPALPSPGRYTALLALECDRPALVLVVDGMAFVEDAERLGFPHCHVVLCGPWKVDVSYQRVVRDGALEEALEQVGQLLEAMATHLARGCQMADRPLDVLSHLATRWKLSEDSNLPYLYRMVLDRYAQLPYDTETWHPLILDACRFLRSHYKQTCNKQGEALLLGLLTRPTPVREWVTGWADARELGLELYPEDTPSYRRFMLSLWARWGRIAPDRVWGGYPYAEITAVLPRAGDIPQDEVRDYDPGLAEALFQRSVPNSGEVVPMLQVLEQWAHLVPDSFTRFHSRLRRYHNEVMYSLPSKDYGGGRRT